MADAEAAQAAAPVFGRNDHLEPAEEVWRDIALKALDAALDGPVPALIRKVGKGLVPEERQAIAESGYLAACGVHKRELEFKEVFVDLREVLRVRVVHHELGPGAMRDVVGGSEKVFAFFPRNEPERRACHGQKPSAR